MPITVQQNIPRINYGDYAPEIVEEPQGSVLGAAFRLENDVVNLIQYASRGEFQADPNFSPMERIQRSPYYNMMPDSFVGVQSDAEWSYVEARIAKELKGRELIASAGIGGIAAAMAAGILSPTILIPVGNAATAGRVSTAAAKTAAMTAFGVGVQEGVLHMNQETRTVAESAFAIGGGAVLGAGLGAAVRYLDPLGLDKIADDMVTSPTKQAILPLNENPEPRGLSAQAATPEERAMGAGIVDPGRIAPTLMSGVAARALGEGAENLLKGSWVGPVTNLMNSPRVGARSFVAEFGNAGIYTTEMLKGTVAPSRGVIEHAVGQYDGMGIMAIDRAKTLYHEWYKSQSRLGFLSGMNYKSQQEFFQATGRDFFDVVQGISGDAASPTRKAAEDIYNTVFMPILKEAQYAGLAPFGRMGQDEVGLRMAMEIVSQKVSRVRLAEDYEAARAILRENAMEKLRDAQVKAEELSLKEDEAGLVAELVKRRAPHTVDGESQAAKLARLDEDDIMEIADEIATEIMRKQMSNGRRHAPVDILQSLGLKEGKFIYVNPSRTWSNGRTWKEFLQQDMEALVRSFTRSMGPDIELQRRFGVNFRSDEPFDLSKKKFTRIPQVKQFMEEIDAERAKANKIEDEAKRKKALTKLVQEEQNFVTQVNALIGKTRHTFGAPEDPNDVFYRAGKAALQLNTMRLMGGVVLSALPDLARPVLKYGFMSTFRNGLKPLLTDLRSFKATAKELNYAGAALELAQHGRANAFFGLYEETDMANTMVERGLGRGTSLLGKIALFDYWNAGLKNFAGNIAMGEIMSIGDKLARGGSLSARQTRFLAGLSIRQNDLKAIMRIVQEEGGGSEVRPGVWLPNGEDWMKGGPEAIDAEAQRLLDAHLKLNPKSKATLDSKPTSDSKYTFRQQATKDVMSERARLQTVLRSALKQATEDTIITPGLELPNWMQGSMTGRLIGQFRSFTFSSHTKAVIAASQEARQGNMAPIAAGALFSLALGVVSYYTWARAVGGDTQARMENEFDAAINGQDGGLERIADEAITRSGLLGAMAEAQKFAERTPGLEKFATLSGTPTAKSPYLNPVLELGGPTIAGAVGNLGRIVATVSDPTTETFRKTKQLMPYQNVFYLRQIFDAMNESAMRAAGVNPG